MKTRLSKKKAAGLLKNKRIAIIGYGSQGRAQALNLRDSGIIPIIGLPLKSKSRKLAKEDQFIVTAPEKAISKSDIIVILAPDHKHKILFNSLDSKILSGKAFIFAHGFSIAFGFVKLPLSCDTILVAPHGPGIRLREMYYSGQSFTAFLGLHNDASGKASKIGTAYAAAIGASPENLFISSFREEAIGDIFGEQAVLCGGLVGLIERGFETLVKNGLSPKNAYLECVYQLDLIIDLIKRHGPAGMFERISKTAAFGSLENKNKLFGNQMEQKMQALYERIESGAFARELIADSENDLASLNDFLKTIRFSLLQKTHDSISPRLIKNSSESTKRKK